MLNVVYIGWKSDVFAGATTTKNVMFARADFPINTPIAMPWLPLAAVRLKRPVISVSPRLDQCVFAYNLILFDVLLKMGVGAFCIRRIGRLYVEEWGNAT